MSDTMSSPRDQWVQFYQQQQQHNPYNGQVVAASTTMFGAGQASEATVTTTIAAAAAAAATTSPRNNSTTTASSNSTSHSLNPEGRVSKPIRRRSRASRRTPTTLLSTDTTNFRAMVQQFTGGAATASFASGMSHSHHYGANNGSGGVMTNMSFDTQRPIRTTAVMAPSGYNVMQSFQQHQHQQQQQHMFMLNNNNNNNNNSTGTGDHGFFQRLSNNGNTRPSMEVAHDIGGVTDAFQVDPIRLPTSSSSNNNIENHRRSNIHYMF